MPGQNQAADVAWPLLSGERILWAGAPKTGLLLYSRDALLIPFSLLWCGFAIFWEAAAFGHRTPVFFRMWGIPFVLAGLYFVAGRFVHDAWIRRRTRYALTNRRVLIQRIGGAGSLTALNLDRLPEVQLNERRDGTGTLRFGPPPSMRYGNGYAGWNSSLDPTPQFIAIANPRMVFEKLQAAMAN